MSLTDVSTWRLATPGGIPFRFKGMTGQLSFDEGSATLTYIIQSSDLAAFAEETFPLAVSFLGNIVYPNPIRLPGFDSLSAQNLTWKGFTEGRPIDPFGGDPAAPADTYEPFLEVSIEFGVSPENDQQRDQNDPFTFLEVSSTASGEFLVSPVRGKTPGDATWVAEGDESTAVTDQEHREIDVGQKVSTSLIEWNLRWTQIPHDFFQSTLMPRLRDSMGKVNEDPMPIFSDAPAETILFLGYDDNQQFTWRPGFTGASPRTVDMKFLEKNFEHTDDAATVQVTHNHEYRPGVGWRRLLINNKPLLDEIDLNLIFGP